MCSVCRFDLDGFVHVKVQPSATLYCLRCFAQGLNKNEDHQSAGFQIIDSLEKKILSRDYESKETPEEWGLREEVQLLEGLQHCGFGNWLDIAQKVGSKTKEQCEQHYMKVSRPYISSGGPTASNLK